MWPFRARAMGAPVMIRPKVISVWVFILTAFWFFTHSTPATHHLAHLRKEKPTELEDITSKYVYATLLTENGLDDKQDNYFLAARLLTYQLIHDPHTKTNEPIPFIVGALKTVSAAKKARLKRDGAIVFEMEDLGADWTLTHPAFKTRHLKDMLTKLRFWELTQFERICLFDSDTVLNGNMDGVFQDPAVRTQTTLYDADARKNDEAPLPTEYALAGRSERHDHKYPPKDDEYFPHYFNAGFLVFGPSKDLFDYYYSLLNLSDGRWSPEMMEQNLLNYAHRDGGNMPWKRIEPIWNTHRPTVQDQQAGVKSLHDKFWGTDYEDLQPYLLQQKEKMLAFYQERDERESKFGFP